MNRLLNIISNDLSIARYSGEADADFIYRVCYSAVALWMLTMTLSCIDGRIGISKQLQAINIEGLLLQYERNLGLNPSCFSNYGNKLHSFPHLIRKVYEETGYLFSDERNYSIAANYGRTIYTGDGHLFFGIPESSCWMNGLGLYCPSGMNSVDLFDAMLRDTLSVEQYISTKYTPLDFEERDIEVQYLQFFNPTLHKPPSSSWSDKQITPESIARSSNKSMYRTLIYKDSQILFKEDPLDSDNERLTSSEMRRLYCALKAKYGAPIIAWFNNLDDTYSEIRISAQLPTREYYFMLLFAWPKQNAFNKTRFISKNSILPTIEKMLSNIGIEVRR